MKEMSIQDIRDLKVQEIEVKIKDWKLELFQSTIAGRHQEKRDTSAIKKLKKQIARGYTVLQSKKRADTGVSEEAKKEDKKL